MTLDYKRLLHYLFPPTKNELLINELPLDFFQQTYNMESYKDVHALLPYSSTHVRSAIHLLKFHNHAHARRLLAHPLRNFLQTIPAHTILIPVPLSAKRLRTRGYNQVTEVIKEAMRGGSPMKFEPGILTRVRDTTPQTSLQRNERLTNLKDAFTVKNTSRYQKQITGTPIILIDDVTTTGATLQAAKNALLPLSPSSIICVALAH